MSGTKAIDQKEYLKRYLSGGGKDGKKKKRKKPKPGGGTTTGRGLSIVDDNLVPTTVDVESDDAELYELAENAPQVAGVFDDRPIHVQAQDRYFGAKWRSLAADEPDEQPVVVGTTSDPSPPRARKRGSDSDASPPRKSSRKEADVSPPRRRSPSPKGRAKEGRRRDDDSDASPPRRGRDRRSQDDSPPRRGKGRSPSGGGRRGDEHRKDGRKSSPPRRRARSSDSDASPPRASDKSRSRSSPPRKGRKSPERRKSDKARDRRSDRDVSLPRGKSSRGSSRWDKAKSPDSDVSPPRAKNRDQKRKDRRGSDSDLSPPRARKSGRGSDSDLSPPRLKKEPITPPHPGSSSSSRPSSSVRIKQEPQDPDDPPRTLEGKRAGLQDARTVKAELEALRRQEQEHFQHMSDHVSGRGAQAVFRDRKTGRKRDLEEEHRQTEEEKEEERKKKEAFARLGRGVVQEEQRKLRVEEALHEAAKPVARYADDEDLERHLRDQEREGDPMLDYLRAKRRRENPCEEKPAYKGPDGPPNRFNIAPGYRWDGVDRSNGYEKKLFAAQNAKQASLEDAYKWSVADM